MKKTQTRILGPGPAILYDDITGLDTHSVTITETGTVTNAENILNPQLSPKAEINASSILEVRFRPGVFTDFDGVAVFGIEDHNETVTIEVGKSDIEGGFASIQDGRLITVRESQFTERAMVFMLKDKARTNNLGEIVVWIKNGNGITGSKFKAGYVFPFKAIQDESLSDSSFEIGVGSTNIKEKSTGGQFFSGKGSVARSVVMNARAVTPSVMFGHPKVRKEVNFLDSDPDVSTNLTEGTPNVPGRRLWKQDSTGSYELEWTNAGLTTSKRYILRYGLYATGDFPTDVGVKQSVTSAGKVKMDFGENAVIFIGTESGKLEITGTTGEGVELEIISVHEIEGFDSGTIESRRENSVVQAMQASRNAKPVALLLSTVDPLWTPDTSFFGIPEWEPYGRLETTGDHFSFRMRLEEAL